MLLLGLAIREAFSFWTAHPFDFEIWVRLGYYVSKGLDPYRVTPAVPGLSIPGTGYLPSIGYPPLWPLIQAVVYDAYSLIGIDNRFFYYFLVKQEMILPDIAVAYLIYKVLGQSGRTWEGERAALFWMLCPYVIIISAVWGMFDQLVLSFLLLALLFSQRIVRSAFAEGIGILLKGIPVIYLPLLALTQRTKAKRLLYLVVAGGLGVGITLLPYALIPGWNYSALAGTGTSIVNKVGNSLNYWVVPYVISNISGYQVSPQALSLAGYLWIPALVVAYFYCYRVLKRIGGSFQGFVSCLLVLTLVFFLTRTQINEQYVIYFLGLGLLDISTGGQSRVRLFHGVWLSALAFLVANNTYMVRFLAPLGAYYSELDSQLVRGLWGDVRFTVMVAAGISFTFFCVAYLRSIHLQLVRTARAGARPGDTTANNPNH